MDNSKIESILVAGGCGFLGSNFLRYAKSQNPDIRIKIIDKLTYAGNLKNVPLDESDVCLYIQDICDDKAVNKLVSSVDLVVNFAAETHNDNAIVNPEPFIQSNIIGTFNLIEACRKNHVRYHHVSTDEVYGDLPFRSSKKFSESSPYNPSSPYSASKAASDLLVKSWIRTYGLKATISNCTNCFGPYQHVEKFIPRTITSIIRGDKPEL